MRLPVIILIALCAVTHSAEFKGDGYYTVIAPGTVYKNENYTVVASVHNTTKPSTLRFMLTGGVGYKEKHVHMAAGEDLKIVNFGQIKDTSQIDVIGINGIIFRNYTYLKLEKSIIDIRVQTDKLKYLPGELIRMRVFFLDSRLRPYQPPSGRLEVRSPLGILKRDNWATVKNGVYASELQLPPNAPLGQYTIYVEDDQNWEKYNFEVVAELMLKNVVGLKVPSKFIVQDSHDFPVIVTASYDNGKTVDGEVTVQVTLVRQNLSSYVNWQWQANVDSVLETHPLEETLQMTQGQSTLFFNLGEFLEKMTDSSRFIYSVKVLATVKDNRTDAQFQNTASTLVFPHRYSMNCISMENACNQYVPNQKQELSFIVKYVDDRPVPVCNTQAKLIFTESRMGLDNILMVKNENNKIIVEGFWSKADTVSFNILLPELEASESNKPYFQMDLQYDDETRKMGFLKPVQPKADNNLVEPSDYFKLQKDHQPASKWRAGDELTLTLNSSRPFSYFIYTVIGQAEIQAAERLQLPTPAQVYQLKLKSAPEWSPYAFIYVYYVDETGHFHYAEEEIELEFDLSNTIEILAPSQAKSGENVTFSIKTLPGSYVGLFAVDERAVVAKISSNAFLNKYSFGKYIKERKSTIETTPGCTYYPGTRTGVYTLSNANLVYHKIPESTTAAAKKYDLDKMFGSSSQDTVPKYTGDPFNHVDTPWIFENFENDKTDAAFEWTKQLPNTHTNWQLRGFAIHPQQGIAFTNETISIKSSKSISINAILPKQIKPNELLKVLVIVHNYATRTVNATVTLKMPPNAEFELVELDDKIRLTNVKMVTVILQKFTELYFVLRPQKIGRITLEFVAAIATDESTMDSIVKVLEVVPAGIAIYQNQAAFINLTRTPDFKHTYTFNPDEEVEYVEVGVIGDLLGPIADNLPVPSGNAEQLISAMAINYKIYRYLIGLNKMPPKLDNTIRTNLYAGYLSLTKFQNTNSNFNLFETHKDRPEVPSTWLNYYIDLWLNDIQFGASISMTREMLTGGETYTTSQQKEKGNYVETSEYYQDLSSAWINSQIMHYKMSDPDHKGIEYIKQHLDDADLTLLQRLQNAAFFQVNDHKATNIASKLREQIQTMGNLMWWPAVKDEHNDHKACQQPYGNTNLQATAYGLQMLLGEHLEKPPKVKKVNADSSDSSESWEDSISMEDLPCPKKNSVEEMEPIVEWLVTQRKAQGNYETLFDTLTVLEALIDYVKRSDNPSAEFSVSINPKDGESQTLTVDPSNALDYQKLQLRSPFPKSMDISVMGKGIASLQITQKLNYLTPRLGDYKINTTAETLNNINPLLNLTLETCVEYLGDCKFHQYMVEISLPTGYRLQQSALTAKNRYIKFSEAKKENSVYVAHYDGLPKNVLRCVSLDIYRYYDVADQQPASVAIYNEKSIEPQAFNFYSFALQFVRR